MPDRAPRLLTFLAILALLQALVGAPASPSRAAGAASLPGGRLHFGLASQPDALDHLVASGVPWRYRYTYLAGGVNTANPWQTWQSNQLPPGQYALDYLRNSDQHGIIPVLTYYELLQSNPSTGTDEKSRDLSNLTNSSTMAAYYADFRVLMKKAGEFGKTAIVHVEPDLWGYLEQAAAGSPAASIPASVASSGDPDVQGIDNTAQGFAGALLHLRDIYAPNALLAIHASLWGTGIDIGSTRDPGADPVHEADVTAAFLGSAGLSSNRWGSTWDLTFNDVDDHDAGWWEQQGANNQWFSHWWDPTNQTLPNFDRYLRYVGELHSHTARPQVVWQVPEGNQYFLTMNNTCGHYQDNVAQYFIEHAADLYAHGLTAVLFGAGNACQTTDTDAQSDGVTNGNGSPTSDVAGWCNACNTHTSTVADDDGGFLAEFVGAYYRSAGMLTRRPSITSLLRVAPFMVPSPAVKPDNADGKFSRVTCGNCGSSGSVPVAAATTVATAATAVPGRGLVAWRLVLCAGEKELATLVEKSLGLRVPVVPGCG